MSDTSSTSGKILELLGRIVDKGFPKLSEKLQQTIVMWILLTLVIVAFSSIAALLAKERFYIPLLLGFILVILMFPLSLWLVGRVDDKQKRKMSGHREIDFQFVNRDAEKEYILGRHLNYCLIDAPAGYGKSTLLSELAEGFRDGGWQTAHVLIKHDDRFGTLLSQVSDALNVSRGVVQSNLDSRPRMDELIHAIKKYWENESDSPGLVLLVDFDNNPAFTVLEELVTDLIPGIQEGLRVLDSFRKKQFRVVIAGRCIASFVAEHSSIPVKEFMLSPFSYRYVRESVENYLTTIEDKDSVIQLAAHTMHLTGGHPDCIQKIIKEYNERGNTPDNFIKAYQKDIWKDIVKPAIDDIRRAIPPKLREYLDNLCVFRYLDDGILKELIEKEIITGYTDAHDLADELTSTYLLNRKGRILEDSITRRLLALRLLMKNGSDDFTEHCERAYSICLNKLHNPKTQMPERWALEALYQSLQKHAAFVHSSESRAKIRNEFFGTSIHEVISALFEGRNKREELPAIRDALDKDWEFRFTVNYYMRKNQYTDEPYQKFIRFVASN